MDKKKRPIVENGYISIQGKDPIAVDSPKWREVLTHIDSFVYRECELYLTVRSEMRRNRRYWYGYRRIQGKLKKVYLGRSESLNSERLAGKAAQLANSTQLHEDLKPNQNQNQSMDVNIVSDPRPIDQDELLLAKLRIPAMPQHMVQRQRLTARLKSPRQSVPDRHYQRRSKPLLTTVVAPSGYGKSTLLSEWVQTVPGLYVAWLSLESEDSDLYQFWRYLIAALQLALDRSNPTFGTSIRGYLQAVKPPPIRTIVKQLLNAIQQCDQRMVLVLDDFHLIDSTEIHHSLSYFITHCPARLHVIISSRTPLPFSLGQLRVQCHITEIGHDELKLQRAEMEELLDRHGHNDPNLLQRLLDRTEGWVTGTNLALLAMANGSSDTLRVLEKEQQYFTDYFIYNVLQQQSETCQQFLLQSAFLDNFSVDLIASVTDFAPAEIKQTLADLSAANLFLIRLDQTSGWYRYHHLFADALRRIMQERNPALINILHRRAAQWHVAHDSISLCIHYFAAADCWTDVADLLQMHGVLLLQKGRLTQLNRWLQSLPETVLIEYPQLMTLYARGLMLTGDLMALESWLSYLEHVAADNPITLAEINQIRAIVHGIEENPDSAENDWWESLNALTVSVNLWTNSRFEEATVAAQRAITQGQAAGNDAVVLVAAGNVAIIHIVTNQLNMALRSAKKVLAYYNIDAEQVIAGNAQPNLAISSLLMAMGYAFYERDLLDKALAYFQCAKTLCEQLGRIDYLIAVHVLIARVLCALEQPDNAQAELQAGVDLAATVQQTFWSAQDIRAYQTWIWLHLGQHDKALAWFHECAFDLTTAPSQPDAVSHWVCAEILLYEGQYAQAVEVYQNLLTHPSSRVRTEAGYKIRLGYAIALDGIGRKSDALDQMEKLLKLAHREKMVRHFLTWRMQTLRLLITLNEARTLNRDLLKFSRKLAKQLEPTFDDVANHPHLVNPLSELTPREYETLTLLAQQLTNREIAERLIISPNTVKSYISNIFGKLEVNNRKKAAEIFRNAMR